MTLFRPLSSLLCLLVSLLAATLAPAATICVGPLAAGNGSGSDWANKAAWGSVSLARGNTYFLEDGAYTARTLSTAVSGSALITIKKAIATDHGPEAGWSATMGDGQAVIAAPLKFTSNHWVFDGQRRAGPRSGHGFKIDNASSPVNQDVTQYGTQGGAAVANITVRFTEIAGSGTRGDAINDSTVSVFDGGRDLTWSDCWIHDSGLVLMFWRLGYNLTAERCVIERNDSTTKNHAEGFVMRGKPTSQGGADTVGNYTVRDCILADIEGTAYIATPSGPTHHFTNLWMYGNIFEVPATATRGGTGDGVFAAWDCNIYGACKFYNNTIINIRDAGIRGVSADNPHQNSGIDIGIGYPTRLDELDVQNNLWVNCDAIDNPTQGGSAGGAQVGRYTWKNNSYWNTGNSTDTDPAKQVLSANPLRADGVLLSATAAGSTLPAPFHLDPLGRARGSDGTWDRGAYEFGGTIPPPAPTPDPVPVPEPDPTPTPDPEPPPPPPPATNPFATGDNVRATATVTVRRTASTSGWFNTRGTQPAFSTGTVTAISGATWVQVDFANGADGWVEASSLQSFTVPPPPPPDPDPAPDPTPDPRIAQLEAQVAALETQVTTLQSQVTARDAQITGHKSEITALQARIAAARASAQATVQSLQ